MVGEACDGFPALRGYPEQEPLKPRGRKAERMMRDGKGPSPLFERPHRAHTVRWSVVSVGAKGAGGGQAGEFPTTAGK